MEVWNADEPDVVEVVLMLSPPLQPAIQELGHAPIDTDSSLQLEKGKHQKSDATPLSEEETRGCGIGLTWASGP